MDESIVKSKITLPDVQHLPRCWTSKKRASDKSNNADFVRKMSNTKEGVGHLRKLESV